MKKTLVRFLVSSAMLWGLFTLPAPAHAQGAVTLQLSSVTGSGPARQTFPETIELANVGTAEATNVTLTFTPPKGAKVDSTCQVDHLPGGQRSYICSIGTLAAGDRVDVSFLFSLSKPADAAITVDVTCDQGATAVDTLWISIS